MTGMDEGEAVETIYCMDIEGGECCFSCHDDDDEGYSPLGDGPTLDGRWYRLCCKMRQHAEEVGLVEPLKLPGS